MTGQRPVLVNLGCGAIAHPAWSNLDLVPLSPIVQKADLLEPLPFESGTVDAVYHAHVLEHFDRESGARFLKENVRVLRPGGVLRVVVPDLEDICRGYLAALDSAEKGEVEGSVVYRWALLELIDQMVRRRSGGDMIEFLGETSMVEALPLINKNRLPADMIDYLQAKLADETGRRLPLLVRVRRRGLASILRSIARGWTGVRLHLLLPGLAWLLGGARLSNAVDEGVFRATGEVHRWMYDRRSLRIALEAAGCGTIALRGPFESAIRNYVSYELDTVGQRVRKPGSLFIEGIKA